MVYDLASASLQVCVPHVGEKHALEQALGEVRSTPDNSLQFEDFVLHKRLEGARMLTNSQAVSWILFNLH